MNIIVVGTNHKYSPVDLREKLFFAKGKLSEAFYMLRQIPGLNGAVILSTCNRTEIYAEVEDVQTGTNEVMNFVAKYKKLNSKILYHNFYAYEGEKALRHLCEVSSGVDSLITGELQIMWQVKEAFREAENAVSSGTCLKNIFHSAMTVAKKVHAKTRISEGKISVGSLAADFIRSQFEELSDKNILVIGIGKITELVLKYLKNSEAQVVFVANRTYDKAKSLANRIGAEAVRFDNLEEFLRKADIVISATASPHFIIKKDVLKKRKKRLFIVDLAVPRDVDPEAGDMDNVDLFSMEDLDMVIKKNILKKKEEAIKAKDIINKETVKLWREFTKLEQEPVLLP